MALRGPGIRDSGVQGLVRLFVLQSEESTNERELDGAEIYHEMNELDCSFEF